MASEKSKRLAAIQLGPGVYIKAGKQWEPKPSKKRAPGLRWLRAKWARDRLKARRARQLRLKLSRVRARGR